MHAPVFLDHLPDTQAILGGKPAEYRLRRNRALMDLLLDPEADWIPRTECPACGAEAAQSTTFSQTHMGFRRCGACASIYAEAVPPQATLDQLRLDHLAAMPPDPDKDRSFEYTSLLNWISLSETRLGGPLQRVLDIRFSTEAAGWREMVAAQSQRTWTFVDLIPGSDADPFPGLSTAIATTRPQVILIVADMDRAAQPGALLAQIKAHADPGTRVFIATSCADGLEYEILGAESPSFVPLDRLTLFSVAGMRALADAQGMTLVEISTPGRLDAVILQQFFKGAAQTTIPFWSGFFRDADAERLHDLQILLQRSLRSGVMRAVLTV